MEAVAVIDIVASSKALLAAVGESSVAIHGFVRKCREARKELAETSRQLAELGIILHLIHDDLAPYREGDDARFLETPDHLTTEIPSIIANCTVVLDQFDSLLVTYWRLKYWDKGDS